MTVCDEPQEASENPYRFRAPKPPRGPGPCAVAVSSDGGKTWRELPNHGRRHSPDGFAWGYHGSGPAALALSILQVIFGRPPSPVVYQAFKHDHVANWRMDEAWTFSGDQVIEWLRENFPNAAVLDGAAKRREGGS